MRAHEAHDRDDLELRVFTHPACSGCGEAVRQAWQLAGRWPDLALRTVSLEREEGLAEARSERVTILPTAILTRGGRELERWVGTPEAGAFAIAIEASTEST